MKKTIYIFIAAAISLILVVLIPLSWQIKNIQREIVRVEKKFKLLKAKNKIPVSEAAYKTLAKESLFLRNKFEKLSDVISPQETIIPENSTDLTVFFKENLYAAGKRLKSIALQKNIPLTGNLGFDEKLFQPDTMEFQMKRLMLVEELVSSLMRNGVLSVNLVSLTDKKAIFENQAGAFDEFTVEVNFDTDEEALFLFLKEMARAEPAVLVKKIRVKKAPDKQNINVETACARFMIGSH